MIRKLTLRSWVHTGVIIFICLAMAAFLLLLYGPSAIEALRAGGLSGEESLIHICAAAFGIVFAAVSLYIFVRELAKSVGKRVKQYLAEHQEVTPEQLDNDFAAAEEFKNIWIGRRWTYSYELSCVLLENDEIAWVYSEKKQSKNSTDYCLCLGLADGRVEKIPASRDRISRIKEVYERYPHILVGNNPEYGYMFKNDLKAFLDIKYYQNAEAGQVVF